MKKKKNVQDATLKNTRVLRRDIRRLERAIDNLITHIIRAEDKANVALKSLGISYGRKKKR